MYNVQMDFNFDNCFTSNEIREALGYKEGVHLDEYDYEEFFETVIEAALDNKLGCINIKNFVFQERK